MELTYPLIIYIGIGALIVAFIVTFFSVRKYKGGRMLADMEMVKGLTYYKWLVIRYVILKFLVVLSLIISIAAASFLATKPTEVKTVTTEKHNRDIFICFDVSTSLDGINIKMCEELKGFIKKLKGERFGISIFNAKSILVTPLTSDYDYAIEMIDMLEESIKAGEGAEVIDHFEENEIAGYRFSGTLSTAGSSMIGDGLATCLYDFPDLDENPDRSRLIVFVTDNDLNGVEVVPLKDACALCAKRNVKVFALAPDFVKNESEFSRAVYSTGGDYYNTRDDNAVEEMLEDVKLTDVTKTVTSVTTKKDVPEAAFYVLLVSICVYFLCAWRVKA